MVYDAVTAGKVLAGLEEVGISNVDLEKIDYANREALALELTTRAVAKARRQAEYMAKPLNQKIGAAMLVSDQVNSYSYYNEFTDDLLEIKIGDNTEMKPRNAPIKAEFKKIRIEKTVSVTFKLE